MRSQFHDELAAMRKSAPVVWDRGINGWVVTTRETAVAVMRDDVTFTVDDPRFSTAAVVGPSMLSLDGDEHQRHRNPFAVGFRHYQAEVERIARELVSVLRPRGEAELRRELAGPLAVATVALALGLHDVGTGELLTWYDIIVAAVDAVSVGEPLAPSAVEAYAQLREVLLRPPPDGSLLAAAANTLNEDELTSNAAVFLFGGIETSEGMTSNLLFHLLSNPDQLALLAADRSLMDAAIEESLRLEPAASRVDRYATRDVVVGNTKIAQGDLVVVSLAAANRDPGVYADPDRFDIGRANARTHLAFAQGPHACLGAQLARIETRAALQTVLELLPALAKAETVAAAEPGGAIFRKPATIHAIWGAGP